MLNENFRDMLTAFDEAGADYLLIGAPLSKVTPEDFFTPDVVYQMGVPPQRIDILTSISGVDFDDAWPDRMIVPIDELSVPVIGLRQLYANKLASGRDKDRQDARILEELIG
jgi:hypothetical protein